MDKKLYPIQRNKGAALAWTLVLFMLIVIVTTSMLFISRQNSLETVSQESRIKAYYLSLSGIEIGYSALMAADSSPGPKYIDQFNTNPTKAEVDYQHVIAGTGTIDITIKNVTVSSKRWIQVQSIGTLTGSGVSATSVMRIDPLNNAIIIREEFGN